MHPPLHSKETDEKLQTTFPEEDTNKNICETNRIKICKIKGIEQVESKKK